MTTETLAGRRILIVEDEYFVATELARALREAGAEVLGPVGMLAKALAALDAETPDAAVLDVNLHGEPSFPIADRLAAAGVPYLFVTGYDEWSLPAEHRDAPRLYKPAPVPTVLATLARLVAAPPASGT